MNSPDFSKIPWEKTSLDSVSSLIKKEMVKEKVGDSGSSGEDVGYQKDQKKDFVFKKYYGPGDRDESPYHNTLAGPTSFLSVAPIPVCIVFRPWTVRQYAGFLHGSWRATVFIAAIWPQDRRPFQWLLIWPPTGVMIQTIQG